MPSAAPPIFEKFWLSLRLKFPFTRDKFGFLMDNLALSHSYLQPSPLGREAAQGEEGFPMHAPRRPAS